MKITTQHLEQKINKAREIDKEVDDNDYDEEDDDTHQFTFDVLSVGQEPSDAASVERAESVLNKSINVKEFKHLLTQNNVQVNISSLVHQNSARNLFQPLSPSDAKEGNQTRRDIMDPQESELKQQRDREVLEQLQIQRTNAKIKQYEDKVKRRNDRDAIFKKLQEEINQFKTEMFQGSDQVQSGRNVKDSSISPRR